MLCTALPTNGRDGQMAVQGCLEMRQYVGRHSVGYRIPWPGETCACRDLQGWGSTLCMGTLHYMCVLHHAPCTCRHPAHAAFDVHGIPTADHTTSHPTSAEMPARCRAAGWADPPQAAPHTEAHARMLGHKSPGSVTCEEACLRVARPLAGSACWVNTRTTRAALPL